MEAYRQRMSSLPASEHVFQTAPAVMCSERKSHMLNHDVFVTAPAVMCTVSSTEEPKVERITIELRHSETGLPRRGCSQGGRRGGSQSRVPRSPRGHRSPRAQRASRMDVGEHDKGKPLRKTSSEPVVRKMSDAVLPSHADLVDRGTTIAPKPGLYRYEKVPPPSPLIVEKKPPVPSVGVRRPQNLWKRQSDKFNSFLERSKLGQIPRITRASVSRSPSQSTRAPSRRSSKETVGSSLPSRAASKHVSERSPRNLPQGSPRNAPDKSPQNVLDRPPRDRSPRACIAARTASSASHPTVFVATPPLRPCLIEEAAPERFPSKGALQRRKSDGDVPKHPGVSGAGPPNEYFLIRPGSPRRRSSGSISLSSPRKSSSPKRCRRRGSAPPVPSQLGSTPRIVLERGRKTSLRRSESIDRSISPPPVYDGPGLCQGSPVLGFVPHVSQAPYLDLAEACTPRKPGDAAIVLGLAPGFSIADARAAYVTAAKHWHPDRPAWVNGESGDRERATVAFRRARAAYDLLNIAERDP